MTAQSRPASGASRNDGVKFASGASQQAPAGCRAPVTPTEQSRLYTIPVTLRVAQAFIEQHHRHHDPTTGHRVATDECPNACSALYGAMCRLQRAHGFAICITYTLVDEPGTSLRAAGWRPVAVTKGGKWTRISRVRADKLTGPKIRWECKCSSQPAINLDALTEAS